MADTNMQERGINPLVAGMVGAVVGAGAAVLTSKVLSDKEMRNRIMKTVSNVRGKITDTMSKAQEEINRGKESIEEGQRAFSHRLRIGTRRGKVKRG